MLVKLDYFPNFWGETIKKIETTQGFDKTLRNREPISGELTCDSLIRKFSKLPQVVQAALVIPTSQVVQRGTVEGGEKDDDDDDDDDARVSGSIHNT